MPSLPVSPCHGIRRKTTLPTTSGGTPVTPARRSLWSAWSPTPPRWSSTTSPGEAGSGCPWPRPRSRPCGGRVGLAGGRVTQPWSPVSAGCRTRWGVLSSTDSDNGPVAFVVPASVSHRKARPSSAASFKSMTVHSGVWGQLQDLPRSELVKAECPHGCPEPQRANIFGVTGGGRWGEGHVFLSVSL